MPTKTKDHPESCLILTGPRCAGKTSLALELAGSLVSAHGGTGAAGLVTECTRGPDGRPRTLELLDLATGLRHPLASRADGEPSLRFSPEAFAWGIDAFRQGASRTEAGFPARLLVLDEIGPLELREGLGWTPLLADLANEAARGERALLLSVREGLARDLASLLPESKVRILRVEEPRRNEVRRLLAAWLAVHASRPGARRPDSTSLS